MSAPVLLGLEWARPLGLLGLALPIAVLLFSRLLERPIEIATGTLAIWERVRAASAQPSARARRRIPPAVWMLAVSLLLGALALAGPRLAPKAERAIRVLVDRSPSMDLPLGAGTRSERAVAMARKWLDREAPGSRVDWLDRVASFGPEDDETETLWVTDRAPEPVPARAGFFASGGPAVPGPIAVEGSTRWDWDGERLVAVPSGAPRRRVEVSGELPEPIGGVLGAWAAARGAIVGAQGEGGPALVLHTNAADPRREVEVGRDGWRAHGIAAGSPPPLSTWLEDAEHRALLSFAPGRIESSLVSMEEPQGDPAAFAVSWGKLFDEVVLPPPGVVELAERLSAGAEVASPAKSSSSSDLAPPTAALDAWLAFGALGAVAAAWGLARRRLALR